MAGRPVDDNGTPLCPAPEIYRNAATSDPFPIRFNTMRVALPSATYPQRTCIGGDVAQHDFIRNAAATAKPMIVIESCGVAAFPATVPTQDWLSAGSALLKACIPFPPR